jgi:hypothetical protein
MCFVCSAAEAGAARVSMEISAAAATPRTFFKTSSFLGGEGKS